MIVHYGSSTIYSILPVLVTTLIPVIHCALSLMIFSIYGLYPSYLILIHNSNCDNRVILHLLTISIVAIRICPSIHPFIHPYSCLPPIRRHWCFLVETSRSLTPVHIATSLPTYLNNVVKEKWFPSALLRPGDRRDIVSDVDRRMRGTAGGDRLTVSSLVSTAVVSHPLVNCLFNAVVSEDAHFGTVDLTDFYLGTTNPNPPFIKIFPDPYPPEVLSSPLHQNRQADRPALLSLPRGQDHLWSQGVREALQRAPGKSPLPVGVCPNLHPLSLSSPNLRYRFCFSRRYKIP